MSSSSSSTSSLVAQVKSTPVGAVAALVGAGAALVGAGAALTLAAAHLVKGWCPVAAACGNAKAGRCPFSGRVGTGKCPAGGSASSGKAKKKPMVVTVTGAAGQIGYAILPLIASGRMLGCDQPVELRLLEIPQAMSVLQGVVMELEDCTFPLLSKVVATDDARTAFQDCDVALLIGAKPRGPGQARADLLRMNAPTFKAQGKAINDYASRTVKVLVVGNPTNTNAQIVMEHAPDLPRTAFTAMTRLDEVRAMAQLAKKAGVNVGCIKNVVVWGNHSDTMYPDLSSATIEQNGREIKALDAEGVDEAWAHGAFMQTVQLRGGAVIAARNASSAVSAAHAAVAHMRDWVRGTAPGRYVSMSVVSKGEYGVPAGLIFSFPCTCANGEYKVVEGLQQSDFARDKMRQSWEQLQQESQEWRSL